MSTPISFTIRPPTTSQTARSSNNSNSKGHTQNKSGWRAPSQRLFNEHAHGEDDDDEEVEDRLKSRFDSGGRISRASGEGNSRPSRDRPAEPLVIVPQPNRDWRMAAQRRVPTYRPDATQNSEPLVTHERTGDEPQRSGLRVTKKEETVEGVVGSQTVVKVELGDDDGTVSAAIGNASALFPVKSEPLTLEEQALQAILAGDNVVESAEEKLHRDLVIDVNPKVDNRTITEQDALQRDLRELPEESTLDDYAAIPVSAFGAAMLRGMGHDPSKDTPAYVPKPRPALLGIGATPMSTELPVPLKKDAKKRREEFAKRGGRGFNASNLLVRRDESGTPMSTNSHSRYNTPIPADGADSDNTRRRRRDDDDSLDGDRENKRRDAKDESRGVRESRSREEEFYKDRREYETEDERARRKARERERESHEKRIQDRDRQRDKERDRERDRRDRERDRDREDRRDRDRGRDRDRYDDERPNERSRRDR